MILRIKIKRTTGEKTKSVGIKSCICIEGNCALHIKNDFEYSSIDFGNGKKCFKVTKKNNNIKKETL